MYWLLDNVVDSPHSGLNIHKPTFQQDGACYDIDNMLTHFDDFTYNNFFNIKLRNILPKDKIKCILTFTHMPLSTHMHLSSNIHYALRKDPNTYLVVMSVLEGVVTPEKFAADAAKLGLPKHKIIVLVSNLEVHMKVIDGIRYIAINFWESYSRHHHRLLPHASFVEPDEYNRNVPKKKKFLCLNRNIKPHRIWFYYSLVRNQMLNDGYISYHLPEIAPGDYQELGLHDNVMKWIPKSLHDDYKKHFNTKMNLRKLDKIKDMFVINYKESIKSFYMTSCVSLITESDHRLNFITEKTFKAIMHLHPFFIIGNPEQHTLLRKRGYETFEDLFGVDSVMNYEESVPLLEKLRNWDLQDLDHTVRKQYKDKLLYNQNHFLTRKISWNTITEAIEKAIHERL